MKAISAHFCTIFCIKLNPIESNQIESNPIESNQIAMKSYQIKSNQIKSNQFRSDQIDLLHKCQIGVQEMYRGNWAFRSLLAISKSWILNQFIPQCLQRVLTVHQKTFIGRNLILERFALHLSFVEFLFPE